MKVLVTGFPPFLEHQENPSEKLAFALAANHEGWEARILPVEFGKAFEQLKLKANDFEAIFCLGLASSRKNITYEVFGMNQRHNPGRPDSGGAEFDFLPIKFDGPVVVKSKMPGLKSLENERVKASFHAGTYVCNDLAYLSYQGLERPSLFIHLPEFKWISFEDQLLELEKLIQICLSR